MNILILFPNHLHIDTVNDVCKTYKIDQVYILQDARYFRFKDEYAGLIRHHPFKILLHDVSTRLFQKKLKVTTKLVEWKYWIGKECVGGETLAAVPTGKWICFDPVDHYISDKLEKESKKRGASLTVLDSPIFILTEDELNELHDKFSEKLIRQTPFYGEVRRRKGILMTERGKWVDGKLTFDVENRLPLPRGAESEIPTYKPQRYQRSPLEKKVIRESIARIRRDFPDHPGQGQMGENPDLSHMDFTREGAVARLEQFCRERLVSFGAYQDAMVADDANPILYHSGISHVLNVGLITPREVVEVAVGAWKNAKLPIASVEGFIRQVIGWREYSRYIYTLWNDMVRKSNKMSADGHLSDVWYSGTTGWTPVDATIKQAFQYGYLHHIQRLMIMGNIMNLLRIHPHEVYRWFMEFAIDSYEWVMVYNVYCMILYADGGMTTTKPYISSSAYVYKMSNGRFKRDGKWDLDWTDLYYAYIGDHQDVFSKNGRTIQMWRLWNKKTADEKRRIHQRFIDISKSLDVMK
jgi:deoxyribodipyrimidine photolyase-related protein